MKPEFWAVWKDGMDYPNLYTVLDAAREGVKTLARQYPGSAVYLLRLEVAGTLALPEKFKATGDMSE
jgi:hypothetical protein